MERDQVLRVARGMLVVAFGAVMASCVSGVRTASAPDTLDEVLRRGELRAGYFVEPPAVMKDANSGDLRGSFVDAIREIASEMGVRVVFVEVDLAQFASGLQSRLYDVCIGPTFRTIPRAKAVAFTNTIFYLGYDGVVKQGKSQDFTRESDIDRPGIRVAVKAGSAIDSYVRTRFTRAKPIVLSGTDLTLPLQAVSSGQADIGLMNEHTVEYYARGHDDVAIVLKANPIQVVGMAWAVRPDDQKWLNFLNTSLEALIATGQMAGWEKREYGEVLRRELIEPAEPSVH